MYKDLFKHQMQFKVEPIVYSQMKCLVYSTCGEGTSTSYVTLILGQNPLIKTQQF